MVLTGLPIAWGAATAAMPTLSLASSDWTAETSSATDRSTLDVISRVVDARGRYPGDLGDIPGVAARAYRRTEKSLAASDPGCHLSWTLVAAIGKVESNHGRFADSSLNRHGVVTPEILGPRLAPGSGFAHIKDTDDGRFDGDTRVDRAMGPMQFIPSTWQRHGADGDGDHRRNPQDIDDAALAAGGYLCASGLDLSTSEGRQAAVFSYNHSAAYVNMVLGVYDAYEAGNFDPPVIVYPYPMELPTEEPSESASPTPSTPTTSAPTSAPTSAEPSTEPPAPTHDPKPTHSPKPTHTPRPTPTAQPTTPTPTPKPTPTDSPSPQAIDSTAAAPVV